MASLIKAVLGSSSSGSQNPYYDPKLTPRVQPNAQDPTKAWDRLKVKQIVKRLVDLYTCILVSRSQTLYLGKKGQVHRPFPSGAGVSNVGGCLSSESGRR